MPFDIVHSDLWTSPILSSSDHRYYALFLDNYSNFLWTYPISHKSQVHKIFLSFRPYIKTHSKREVKAFQCDNGREYDNGPFQNFCAQHGMTFRFSCPHTSPQNGKAKRTIMSINNIFCTLLAHSSIPPSFWHHALQMVTYLQNILPIKVLGYQSPTQILYQKNPSYSHFRIFGCLCYPLFPSTSIHKLQARSTPCVFLGYPTNHRGYKYYDLSSRKTIISRHVNFEVNEFPFSKINSPKPIDYQFLDDNLSPHILHHLQTAGHSPNPMDHATPTNSHHEQTSPIRQEQAQPLSPPHSTPSLLGSSPQGPSLPSHLRIGPSTPSPNASGPPPLKPSCSYCHNPTNY